MGQMGQTNGIGCRGESSNPTRRGIDMILNYFANLATTYLVTVFNRTILRDPDVEQADVLYPMGLGQWWWTLRDTKSDKWYILDANGSLVRSHREHLFLGALWQ